MFGQKNQQKKTTSKLFNKRPDFNKLFLCYKYMIILNIFK